MSETSQVLHAQTDKLVSYEPRTEMAGAIGTAREYRTSSTGERPTFTKFLDDEAYKEALSGLVIKCVDIIIYDPDTGRVLVGTRDQEPQAGDWVIGGRMRAGETQEEAAVRNLRRELGDGVAELATGNLRPVGVEYDMVWDSREQGATVNQDDETVTSTHLSSSPMALPVHEATFNTIAKHNEEFSGLRWEDGFDIIEAPAGQYHPAHQDMIFDTFDRVAAPLDLERMHSRAYGNPVS